MIVGGGVELDANGVKRTGVGTGMGAGRTSQNNDAKPAIRMNIKIGTIPIRVCDLFGFNASIAVSLSSSGGRSWVMRFGLGGGRNFHSRRVSVVTGAFVGAARSGTSSTEICAANASDDSSSVVVLSRSFGFFRSAHRIMREK